MDRPTALGIPNPWSGADAEQAPRSYTLWFWLYQRTRRLRHRLGRHDWQYVPALSARRCTWCGKFKH